MICPALTLIGLSKNALAFGSKMDEYNVRPDCLLSSTALDDINHGKEESIAHMIEGGNGYPYAVGLLSTAFSTGCTAERRDLRSMLLWSSDLGACEFDRKKGKVQ